jgi:hypothetical protein
LYLLKKFFQEILHLAYRNMTEKRKLGDRRCIWGKFTNSAQEFVSKRSLRVSFRKQSSIENLPQKMADEKGFSPGRELE